MTLSIDIPPELLGRLEEEARRRGIPPEELATRLIRERFISQLPAGQPEFDLDRELDEFFAANPERVPSLPVDFSRDDIYSDHD